MYQKPEWKDMVEKREIERTHNSKIIISAVADRGQGDITVSLCEFAKYAKKEEREQGLKAEDMEMRPGKNRLTFKTGCLDEVIESLVALRKELKAKGLA